MTRATAVLLVALLIHEPFSDVSADEVYRWVDEDGVVHFSQWPPESEAGELSTVDIDASTPEDYDPNADPYSVLNQSARIHQLWSDLQAEKEDAKEEARQRSDPEATPLRTREYFLSPFRFSHLPRFRDRDAFAAQRRQLEVLDEFDRLPIPDAVSINSSWHRQRVTEQRQVFRDVARGPRGNRLSPDQ